jgi:hypothetical protein
LGLQPEHSPALAIRNQYQKWIWWLYALIKCVIIQNHYYNNSICLFSRLILQHQVKILRKTIYNGTSAIPVCCLNSCFVSFYKTQRQLRDLKLFLPEFLNAATCKH